MPPITDPALLSQLETPQTRINGMGGGGRAPGGGGGTGGLTAQAYSKLQGQVKALDLVEAQLNHVEGLYGRYLKGRGLSSVMEYLPTPKNRAFQTAADGILPLVRQALSTSAKDGDSDRELATWQNLIPNYKAYDETNEQRIATLRRLIQKNREETERILGGGATGGGQVSPTIQRVR
jgi:hypothetical protein